MVRTQRALVVAVLCTVAFAACGKGDGGKRQGPPPLAVDVAKAQRQDIATYLALDGQIAPLQEATLSTPQSGTVAAVYVTEGQRVARGELLAKLDDSTLRASLAQQQAVVAGARAHLGSSTLQGNITPAQSQSTVATAQQQVEAARNNVQTAQAALDNARLVFTSNEQLFKQGYVSQTAFEQSRSQYVAAQQSLNNARQQQQQSQIALRSAQASGTNAVPIQNQAIASDRASVDSANAAVRLLQTQIAQTALVAPFDGVITQRLLDPGAFAGPNQPVVRISQVAQVYVNINVPDNDLAYVKQGTPVSFTSSSAPGRTFHGAISDVNATPTTGTLSYRARVIMSNPGNALRGGMLVSASVRKEFHPNVVVVPRTAVVQSDAGSNVYTVVDPPAAPGGAPAAGGGPPPAAAGGPPGGPRGGAPFRIAQAKLVPVTVGLQTDTQAEVEGAGIAPGSIIITTRPDALQDKSLVAISTGGGPPGGGAPRHVKSARADAP